VFRVEEPGACKTQKYGEIATLHNNHEEAARAYKELVTKYPNSSLFHFKLGASLWQCGNLNESLIALRTSCFLNSNFALPAVEVAIALEHLSSLEDALAAIELAADNHPHSVHLCQVYGLILFQMDRHSDAVIWLEKSLSLAPENPYALWHIAISYGVLGEKQKCRRYAKRADLAGEKGPLIMLNDGTLVKGATVNNLPKEYRPCS